MTRWLAIVAALLALACGASRETPSGVVGVYFRALGADPIRTLALVTPEFHRRHALPVATAGDAQALAERRAASDPDEALALDRHQLGWLAIQSRPELAKLAGGLAVQVGDAEQSGDAAHVSARIEPPGAPAFEQRFALVRERGVWRIDAVEQRGVVAANATAAFAAWPNEAARRTLAGGRR